jgi:O-antigen ligase
MIFLKSFIAKIKHNGIIPICLMIFSCFFIKGHLPLSLSVLGLALYSLLFFSLKKVFTKRDIIFFSIIIFYVFIVLSGLWSQDLFYFFQKMNLKSSLLAVAFSFLWLPDISLKQFEKLTIALLVIFVLSSFMVIGIYLKDIQVFSHKIMQGQPLWVPMRSHIRYGLLLNFCFLLALYFTSFYHQINKRNSIFYGIMAVYLFVFIHFLSVRSAILAMYIALICFGVFWVIKTRKIIKASLIMTCIVILSYTMILFVPTLSRKIGYMRWDIQEFLANPTHKYSDGSRWHSIQIGVEIFMKNKILGVGEGDMKQAIVAFTGENRGEDVMLPHNEYVYIAASNGFVGLFLFLMIIFASFWISWRQKELLPFAYTASMCSAFMVEPMLETQIGILVFVVPFCLFHKIENRR